MLKHVAKIDKNIKTHFISSNKYFITNNIYPKRDKMKHILKPETKESPYRSFASKPHTPCFTLIEQALSVFFNVNYI